MTDIVDDLERCAVNAVDNPQVAGRGKEQTIEWRAKVEIERLREENESIQDKLRNTLVFHNGRDATEGYGTPSENVEAADRIDKLEKALRFYADEDSWKPVTGEPNTNPAVEWDMGQKAREALGEGDD